MAVDRDKLFEELFQHYYRRVVSYLMYLGFPLEESRDLAQEAYLRVYKTMEAYRGEAQWTFLKKTARNLALNRVRDASTIKRKGKKVAIEDIAEPADPAPSVDRVLEAREESAAFFERYLQALETLPEKTRRCLLLRSQGRSYLEIAAILRMPLNSVKSRLHDAKRTLRDVLGELPGTIIWPGAAGEDA